MDGLTTIIYDAYVLQIDLSGNSRGLAGQRWHQPEDALAHNVLIATLHECSNVVRSIREVPSSCRWAMIVNGAYMWLRKHKKHGDKKGLISVSLYCLARLCKKQVIATVPFRLLWEDFFALQGLKHLWFMRTHQTRLARLSLLLDLPDRRTEHMPAIAQVRKGQGR